MENNFLIDTNVFINIMSGQFPVPVREKIDPLISSNFFISIINKIEMLGFKNISSMEENAFQTLIKRAKIIYLHQAVVHETIAIRKQFTIKVPDAIIAASCLSVNAVLLTSNTTDFKKISNLKVLNPLELI